MSIRYKNRKLTVVGRVNNMVIAKNKVKTFEIPVKDYEKVQIL
jgi:hypothetical protein